MKVIKRIHPGYKEWERARKNGHAIKKHFGKWHYIYSSKRGKVSLVKLYDLIPFFESKPKKNYFWEIYCLEGDLFDDVERFDTKKEAVKRIKKLIK